MAPADSAHAGARYCIKLDAGSIRFEDVAHCEVIPPKRCEACGLAESDWWACENSGCGFVSPVVVAGTDFGALA